MSCRSQLLLLSLWKEALATKAKLVWRAKHLLILPKTRKLADGSYLGKLYQSPKHRRQDRDGIVVRIVDYRIDGFRENYRLVTNILDPAMAPALELARLYSERWTIETAVDELKTHLRGGNVVLFSDDKTCGLTTTRTAGSVSSE